MPESSLDLSAPEVTALTEALVSEQLTPDIAYDALIGACKRLTLARKVISSLKLTIGKALLVIEQHPDTYLSRGYKNFDDFLSRGVQDAFGLPRSEAYNTKRLAGAWSELSPEEADAITYSKLSTITRRVNQDSPDAQEWITFAKTHNIEEVRERVIMSGAATRSELEMASVTVLCTKSVKQKWASFSSDPRVISYCGSESGGAILLKLMDECEVEWLNRAEPEPLGMYPEL